VKEECERSAEAMKKGLMDQDELMANMDQVLETKGEEITQLTLQVETLLQDSVKVKELTKANEDLHEQSERLKIKVTIDLKSSFLIFHLLSNS
jgi:ethanolamine utilization protein EutA (predicted chaperonin)